ncbi:MAG: DUF1476 family protein [Rhodobacteraceae bacterium]|nr:DUF1476 family protein [Paracoccaceae bacterium]
MSAFDDRENAFEAKFAHDQEKEFHAEMMVLQQIKW